MKKNNIVTAKKSKSGKTLEVRIPAPAVSNSQNQKTKKNKKKKGKRAKNGGSRNTLVNSYIAAQRYPDLIGPCRFPRYGGSDRTGLAMDRARAIITGSATNTVQGIQLGTGYFGVVVAQQWAVTTISSAIGSASTISPGSAFPNTANIADINQTAGVIVVTYTGSPLNATGEVIIGCALPVLNTATYNSLYFYPGTIKFAVADLINNPQRAIMRKLSAAASEFIALNTNQGDLDLPFVFTSGLNTGGTITVEICRTFEYRSTTADASVVPYEKFDESFTVDANAFQDAQAVIAEIPYAVSPALPGTEESGFIPYYAQMAQFVGVGSISSALTGLVMQRMSAGRHRGHPFGRVDENLSFV